MKAKIYTTISKKLIKNWDKLWRSSPSANYINGPQWFLSVLETFRYKDFKIIAVSDKGRLCAIAALIRKKKWGVWLYTVSPSSFTCGIPFLIKPDDTRTLKSFIYSLTEIGDIYIENVPQHFTDLLKEHTPKADTLANDLNYWMTINKDAKGEVVIRKRNKQMRAIRDNEKDFTLRSYIGKSSQGLKAAFEIDTISRKHVRGYDTFSENQIKEFYSSLAKNFHNLFLTNILYFKHKPIAYEIGFIVGSVYHGSQIAFVDGYAQYSPGRVLMVKLLESLGREKSITQFSFGSGNDHVKRSFTKDYNTLHRMIISSNTIKRKYIVFAYKTRDSLFTYTQKNLRLYTAYRNLRGMLRM